jgi:hypothetical protein
MGAFPEVGVVVCCVLCCAELLFRCATQLGCPHTALTTFDLSSAHRRCSAALDLIAAQVAVKVLDGHAVLRRDETTGFCLEALLSEQLKVCLRRVSRLVLHLISQR